MNTELRKKPKIDFEKDVFKQTHFRKNHKKCGKTQGYQTCNRQSKNEFFSFRTKQTLLTIKMILTNKVNLGLLILELSKIKMYRFLYDYVKRKEDLVLKNINQKDHYLEKRIKK